MELMDGVTLIKECTTTSIRGNIITIASIAITLALSLGIFTIGISLRSKTCNSVYGFIGTALAGTVIIIGRIVISDVFPELDEFQEPNGKYEVTVNSNVDMTEFQNKYDIIDYENGVYIIKIKKAEEATTEINGKVYKITPIE